MVNTKHAFWQALVFTIIIFSIGLVFGYFLEVNRSDDVQLSIIESEINLLDEQIRSRGIDQFNVNCAQSIESTINFADDIYREALKLEKYDATSKFTDSLRTLHKRYDLLRMILWMDGINLKEKCEEKIHTVVYLFAYATDETRIEAQQASLSRLLSDLKNKHGPEILLIPIAANLDLESINIILNKYEITELPAIIIDEEKIIKNQINFEDLEAITFEHQGYEKLEGNIFEMTKFAKIQSSKNTIFLN